MKPLALFHHDKGSSTAHNGNKDNESSEKTYQAVGDYEAEYRPAYSTCRPIDVPPLNAHKFKGPLKPPEQWVSAVAVGNVRFVRHAGSVRHTEEHGQCLGRSHKEDTGSHNHHDGLLHVLLLVVHLDVHRDGTDHSHDAGDGVTQLHDVGDVLGNLLRHGA